MQTLTHTIGPPVLRLALAALTLTAVDGCRNTLNEQSCQIASNAGHPGCPDAPPEVGGPCHDSTTCTLEGFPICDTEKEGGTCVQCTATQTHECNGKTPICTNDICTGCTKHTDCLESNTCLPDSSCASSGNVAYVDGTAGTDGGPCSKDTPCTKIQVAAALKPIVKVSGVVKAPCSITTGTVQIVADPDAMLTPTIAGPALEVKGTANIEIHDLQISNTIGTDAPGVTLSGSASLALIHVTVNNNSGHGIDASGGTIIVTRSTISNNINSGIRVTGTVNFHVVGNVIFGNGTPGKAGTSGLFIGVDAQPLGVSSNEIAFNSISHNVGGSSDTGSGSGTQCTAVTPLVASSNVIWNNGPFSLSPQVSGAGCSYIFSDIGPVGVGTTDSNINSDPMFADEAAGNLHLLPTSVVIQKADPTATLDGLAAKDIDGDLRVKAGAEMAADMGADQVRVQFHAGEALGRATKP